jgi:flagellar biosynthesis protein FliP
MHPFVFLMVGTFIAALVVLALGVTGMGRQNANPKRATRLMALRVGLCFALLCEMLVYANFIR